MVRRFVLSAVGIGALVAPGALFAQYPAQPAEIDVVGVVDIDVDRSGGMEMYAPGEDDDDDASVTVEIDLSSEVDSFDNVDLRALDESDTQSIIDSDDRTTLGHSGIFAAIELKPVEALELELGFDADLLWGEEPVGRTSGGAGDIDIVLLNAGYALVDTESVDVSLRFGRQYFEIGGVPDDFVLAGLADAITGTIDFGVGGAVRGLVLDLYSASTMPENGYFAARPTRTGAASSTRTSTPSSTG